ncbi:hypothetical protein EJ06DRAFT_532342 [Trichodelitschia bisporula]|uniref:DUF7728 domain-containing protein n=1 Tax=Trichodelitschia bisporula TaxID=703511 RepID=A0A6G1HPR4_9PEZI|nr:hypothetical protein EJ06DRAFT_532342 [Trichodelitschia bisporula]
MSHVSAAQPLNPGELSLDVACRGCPFASAGERGELVWEQGVENAVRLNFTTTTNPPTIFLNGAPIFPPSLDTALSVAQIANAPDAEPTTLPITSFTMNSDSRSGDEDTALLTLNLHIDALAMHSIRLPTVVVTALRGPDGEYALLDVKADEAAPLPEKPEEDKCEDWVCRWQAAMRERLNRLYGLTKGGCKGMGRGKGAHHRPGSWHGVGRPHRPHAPVKPEGEKLAAEKPVGEEAGGSYPFLGWVFWLAAGVTLLVGLKRIESAYHFAPGVSFVDELTEVVRKDAERKAALKKAKEEEALLEKYGEGLPVYEELEGREVARE